MPEPETPPGAASSDGETFLTRTAPALSAVSVDLGWRLRPGTSPDFDLDASAIAVGSGDRVLSDDWFVFYNNPRTPDGSIRHSGDRTTAESIEVDLATLPETVTAVVFPLSIYDAEARGHSLDALAAAYVRVADRRDGAELARYEVPAGAWHGTALVAGELRREQDEWLFRVVGRGCPDGLAEIARTYGVHV
ncbi:TerD family protein [Nocardia sp. BMG111209]|uniref:TerD family protein n=1 Tax=Nocardia sp. BMG111209 TaxID=1160137 RepID=UPI0035105AAA